MPTWERVMRLQQANKFRRVLLPTILRDKSMPGLAANHAGPHHRRRTSKVVGGREVLCTSARMRGSLVIIMLHILRRARRMSSPCW